MNKTIYFDIDGVLANIVEYVIRKFKPILVDDTSYSFNGMFVTSDSSWMDMTKWKEEYWLEVKPYTRARNIVTALSIDYDIVYWSARPTNASHITEDWLEINYFPKGVVKCFGSTKKKIMQKFGRINRK